MNEVPLETGRHAFAKSVVPLEERVLLTGLDANLEDEAHGH